MSEKIYPILPLRDIVVYPCVAVPLFVGREKSIAALDAAVENEQEILLIPQYDPKKVDPTIDDLHTIGTLGRIVQLAKLSDGSIKVLVEGISRVRIIDPRDTNAMLVGSYETIEEKASKLPTEEINALINTACESFAEYSKNHERNADEMLEILRQMPDIGRLADMIAANIDIDISERIALLSQESMTARIQRVLVILEQEHSKSELENKIKKRVKAQMEKNQREYYLNEKIKAIQKELSDMENVLSETEQLEAQIRAAKMPKAAEKKALTELSKLQQMSTISAEANVIRNYLEWMIDFPWSKRRRCQYDLKKAERILNRDHYGLADVKERILEYLAVQKRGRTIKGPIICLVGPPGVGKTSLGKSIAESTGRDFERIALGGMHDEAEIRGHRRTYIGALPGKIVQKLCKVGSNNPVILLDEIDKIGADYRSDPSSALLEVLDPAQNNTFNDHYLETDIDLSKVLFIATANTLNIPGPLLDRMEVIRLPGYTTQEKIQIAERYIVPRQRRENALKKTEFLLEDNVVPAIIEHYTREAGVRNLEREIGKLARKSVRRLTGSKHSSVHITSENLEDFLGVAKFRRNEDDLIAKIGCVTGLAWTSVGGELLQIETIAFSGKGKLTHTGQLGDVMKESIQAAMSVVRAYLDETDAAFRISNYDIHMHLPEGATPKDGPSAGIAMATALLSALTRKAVRGDIAMTGEITLHGRVLAIGGLKEKLIAAHRGHIKTVLIPKDNVQDLRDIPEYIKKSLEIIPVTHVNEVFTHAFADHLLPVKVSIPIRSTPVDNLNPRPSQ